MHRGLAAAVAVAVMTWAPGVGAESLARTTQADRPGTAAAETLGSAKTYFDQARKLGFPAAGTGPPYVLRADFTTRASSGQVETGTYTDTWESDSKWRREAVLGKSRFVRSRNGKKYYRLDEGPDAPVLQFVLTAMEPIPATESVDESEWKVKQETVDGKVEIRVARGRENRDGTPDPKQFEGYWFDETGQLIKTYLNGLETRRSKFDAFNGVLVARQVEVLHSGKVGMRMNVTALGPAGPVDSHIFVVKKHEWVPQYMSEAR
jgi:hypothetical protein